MHKPTFKHVLYAPDTSAFSTNLSALDHIIETVDIQVDPYVRHLRKKLNAATKGGKDWIRHDQLLSKAIDSKKTFCHKGLQDFARMAHIIEGHLGAWAADWYVYNVVQKVVHNKFEAAAFLFTSLKSEEKKYLREVLSRVAVTEVSFHPDDVEGDVTPKVDTFIDCLLEEQSLARQANEDFSALIFVTARIEVLALSVILQHHPRTQGQFRTGTLVGTSDNSQRRNAFMDLTRTTPKIDEEHEGASKAKEQHDVLMEFRIGELDLLICTSVAEEGIDIQSCGLVIRWVTRLRRPILPPHGLSRILQ